MKGLAPPYRQNYQCHLTVGYDIYSILKSGVDIHTLIDKALVYSQHRLKSKNLLSMLTRGDLFVRDENFQQLQPIYDVDAHNIESFIRQSLGKR